MAGKNKDRILKAIDKIIKALEKWNDSVNTLGTRGMDTRRYLEEIKKAVEEIRDELRGGKE